MPRAARVAYHRIRGQRPRQQLFRLLERAHVRRWIATDERCTRQTMLFVLQFAYSFALCSKCFPPHLPDEECHSAATSWMQKCISARSRRTACGVQHITRNAVPRLRLGAALNPEPMLHFIFLTSFARHSSITAIED